ncbi:MAG: type II secretion system protein M [SAR324 cluster bacterium]|nr:type II secretion system protein M [SAR324 cluster bacterium]
MTMPDLTQREKLLIGVMLTLLVVFILGLSLRKISRYESDLQLQILARQKQLESIEKSGKEWLSLQEAPTAPVMRDSLSSFIEQTVRRLGMHEFLQLNVLPTNPTGMEGVQVRIDQLNLDQLFNVIYTLEKNRPVLLIDQLEIAVSPGSRLLKTSFKVYKQRAE